MFVNHYICEGFKLGSSVCHSGGLNCPKFMHKSKYTKIMVGDELRMRNSKTKSY